MQPIRIIKLVNGGETIIEERDYEKVAQYRWFQSGHGYAQRQGWKNKKHWQIFLHRVINETPDRLLTDHINGNKLDNRRSNLRTANKAQNSTNRPKIDRRVLTCKFKGVSWHKSTRLWRARISDNGYEKCTYHKTEQQAALDYNKMALERFGEYSSINKLEPGIEPTQRVIKTSKYRGVCLEGDLWRAATRKDGKFKRLGRFKTEEEAALAYNAEVVKIHGSRARLNVVQ